MRRDERFSYVRLYQEAFSASTGRQTREYLS